MVFARILTKPTTIWIIRENFIQNKTLLRLRLRLKNTRAAAGFLFCVRITAPAHFVCIHIIINDLRLSNATFWRFSLFLRIFSFSKLQETFYAYLCVTCIQHLGRTRKWLNRPSVGVKRFLLWFSRRNHHQSLWNCKKLTPFSIFLTIFSLIFILKTLEKTLGLSKKYSSK